MNSNSLERQIRLMELFHGAPICKTTGMKLSYNDQGQALFHMPYNPGFDHALHQIHGGLIATMLDNAGWFTVAPNFDCWVATVEFSTRLLEVTEKEDLISIGKIIRLGKKITTCEMEVRSPKGKLVAIGSGTFVTSSVPLK